MDTQVESKISLQDIKDLLPRQVELCYVDYRDNLDDHIDLLQECIRKQDLSPLGNEVYEWFWEQEIESLDFVQDELKKDLISAFDIEDQEADDLLAMYEDELCEEIENRDNSHPVRDLLRNTNDLVCFYDTGFEVDSESWAWNNKELHQWRDKVKRVFQIDRKNHDYDRKIEIMLSQASYGGRLVVYFLLDSDNFEQICNLLEFNTIQFTNPMIAIIDTWNGSGDNTDLPKVVCQFKLDKDNLTFDKTIKYNYTYEVCGMSSNWCDCTDYKLLNVEKPKRINKSSVNAEKQIDDEYAKIYKSGACSFGDMDTQRHRNMIYVNDFPCGTHCKDCGTFWID